MRFTMFLLGAAAVVATSANAADWAGFSGRLTGDYSYSDVKGIANNTYGFGGEANYTLPDFGYNADHLNVQGQVGYSETKSLHVSRDNWTSGGAVTWQDSSYAAGFGGSYNSLRYVGADVNYGSYGLFGEYYLDNLTLAARGGIISASLGAFNHDGGYFGAGASYYVLPNLAIKGDLAYNSLSSLHWSDYEIGAEYMPISTLPVSVSAAYTYTRTGYLSEVGHSDGLMVRLAWHLGQGSSLVEFDRSGPLDVRGANLPVNDIIRMGDR